MANEKTGRVGVRSFGDVVGDLAGGDIERQLSHELAELARKVDDTGLAGELTLTLKVAKDGKMIRVVAGSKLKLPKAPIEATAFFVDDKGALCTENPRQVKMPLQVADSGRPDGN